MVIIETPIFTRRIQAILSDEEYRLLQIQLINKPDSGKVIRGSGGPRKLRWSAGGHGKRGGVRVIYYWFVSQDILLLLFVYPKSEQDELTPKQLRQLRQLKKVVEGEYR
jgi:mRNA-degrading endonuclease RelE of RelBE toxin-antitoxin system